MPHDIPGQGDSGLAGVTCDVGGAFGVAGPHLTRWDGAAWAKATSRLDPWGVNDLWGTTGIVYAATESDLLSKTGTSPWVRANPGLTNLGAWTRIQGATLFSIYFTGSAWYTGGQGGVILSHP